ncbi:TIGR03084 family metal-binding protein [Actinocorallia lasiicapitis]
MTDFFLGLLADLQDEGEALDRTVRDLPDLLWALPTPAEGWTVAHQIAHLLWTDEKAYLSATDADAFIADLSAVTAPESYVDEGAARGARLAPAALLRRWRAARNDLMLALAALPPDTLLAWYGPPMKATSMVTARLMETWAHGQDVRDALGVSRPPSHRLRHIAHLGVRTRDHAFVVNGLPVPQAPFRVELAAPDGSVWAWGPRDAAQNVTGPAEDFCLLVTRRRHRDDLGVRAVGADAVRWLEIAQAFAGPPGSGRPPLGIPTAL